MATTRGRKIKMISWLARSISALVVIAALAVPAGADDIEPETRLVTDPVITKYVNQIGQNLVRNSDAEVPFTIKAIDSTEINAFALPGGYLYINTGLILAADEEAELAGVLAHEIAHVTARHGTESQTKSQIINLASIPLIFLGVVPGLAARQVAEFAIPMTFLKFSRRAEEEADYLGTQYMYRTGYDPAAMITMSEKLQAQQKSSSGKVSGLFSSHPAKANRIEKTKETIVTVLPERDEYALTTSKFDRIKDRRTVAENRIPARDDDQPSLRRRTRRPNVSGKEPAEDDRPVLRRSDGSHDF
jgi:predicted Zn-dependent protease